MSKEDHQPLLTINLLLLFHRDRKSSALKLPKKKARRRHTDVRRQGELILLLRLLSRSTLRNPGWLERAPLCPVQQRRMGMCPVVERAQGRGR